MPKLKDVLKANGVAVVSRQQVGDHDWLLMVAHTGDVSFPSPVLPSAYLYATEAHPANISDEEAAMIQRKFNPLILPPPSGD